METVTEDELRLARSKAVDAGLEADRLEAQARKARRTATGLARHYEDLLAIYEGQLTIEDVTDEHENEGSASPSKQG